MPIHATQKLRVFLVFGDVLASLLFWMSGSLAQDSPATKPPTFYRDVLPILEQHCQVATGRVASRRCRSKRTKRPGHSPA